MTARTETASWASVSASRSPALLAAPISLRMTERRHAAVCCNVKIESTVIAMGNANVSQDSFGSLLVVSNLTTTSVPALPMLNATSPTTMEAAMTECVRAYQAGMQLRRRVLLPSLTTT